AASGALRREGQMLVRIGVAFHDAALSLASIRLTPSRLDRWLFGAVELDDLVAARQIPGGGLLWLHGSTGRRIVNDRIVAAIERQRLRERAQQRLASEVSR